MNLKSISRKYKKNPSLSGQRGKFSDLQTLKKQLSVTHINEIFSLTQPHKFLAKKQKKSPQLGFNAPTAAQFN